MSRITLPPERRERPSRHGAMVGKTLSALEAEGRALAPDLPDMCATCAFRDGCMTNQMASTVLIAIKCLIGADSAAFACHHGMVEGEPTRLCAGYAAALQAPWASVQIAAADLNSALATLDGLDPIRADFDAWVAEIDPDNTMDDYQRGRLFLKRRAAA